jgi:hypothetical protein
MQALNPPQHRRKSYIHSFANEWLVKSLFKAPTVFYELYQGDKQILTYDKEALKPGKSIFSITPDEDTGEIVNTCVTIGVNLRSMDNSQEKPTEITDYNRLMDLGYMIISIPFSGWHKYQKRAYKIVPKSLDKKAVDRIPAEHQVFWDVYNKRLILVGINAGPAKFGPWVEINPKRVSDKNREARKTIDYFKNAFAIEKDYIKNVIKHNPEKQKKMLVPEMAFMIDNKGSLICIPKSMDEPTIGIIGMKGTGKSWILHRFVDLGYWKGRRMIALLNDENNQCSTWCLPWDADPIHKKFGLGIAKQLALIGERPLPLPMVYNHPMNENLRYMTYEDECGIRISFPFGDMISNYENYMHGKKNWELGKSLPYFKNIKGSLLQCKNAEEIHETINTMINEELGLTKIKLNGVMDDIFNENILDITNGIPSKMKLVIKDIRDKNRVISEFEYNPFVAQLLAGLVPALETASIKNKGYFPQQFKFIAEDIYRKQCEDPYFINNKFRIWLVCDEIQTIDNKKSAASDVLIKIVTEGRNNRVGFIWATQNPERLSEQITTNTPYLIVLGLNNDEQAKSVVKNFELMSGTEKEIKSLGPLEAIACATGNKHFIVYERDGTKRKSERNESFRGMLLPPLSQHRPPAEDAA